ncbi:MAG: PAS domain S-box protein [Desulfobacterales bacterium]
MAQDPKRPVANRCWQQLGCNKTLCPAYDKGDMPCWGMQNTLCRSHCNTGFSYKFEDCLVCPVFKDRAETEPCGWNHFVLDQVRYLARDVLKDRSQKEQDLLQLLNNLPDGLFTMDKEGRVTYFNSAAERITGISASDALGMHCRQIFKTTTCQIDCPSTNSTQIEKNVYNRGFAVTTLDGRSLSITTSISVLKDQAGNVIGGVQVFRDVSDRKRLEDDLRLSEIKYRRIFEGSKDMIFITAKDGMIKDVNPAAVELLGYDSKKELLSLYSVEDVYQNPMHWQVFKKQIDRHGFVKDFEAAFKRKDGTRMHCLLSGNAVRNEIKEIIGYEGIVKDITARMDAIRDLQKHHRELSLLNAVALVMNATQDLDDILMTALKNVLEVLNLTSGGIFLIDHETSTFELKVQQGLFEKMSKKSYQAHFHDQDLMQSLLKETLALEPRPSFPTFTVVLKGPQPGHSIQLTCFLITAKEKACGFLALDFPSSKDFTEQDLHLLGSLGNFLGGAIENTQLLMTIHKHREELKGLTARLFQSQELERRRIARELHDEAGQALTGINFTLETIGKGLAPESDSTRQLIDDVKKQINHTYQGIRRLSYTLHPALLSDLGLEPALDSYMTGIAKHTEMKIDFKMVGFKKRLDPEIETVIYRLSQEALTNTLKHAAAKHFRLSIIKGYPHIIFAAEDDGVGFDASEFNRHKDTLGLLSMRERASMLGGSFTIRATKGKGTQIRIKIPLNESRHE